MTLLKRLGLILPASLFAATLLIAGCSGGSNSGVSGGSSGDLDKDGIVDQHDPDIDGDGIPNGSDPDIDGDGIPNDQDNDIDGDGKPNDEDPTPDGNGGTPSEPRAPCSAARIIVPNDELRAGTLTTLKWELLPEGCGVSSDTPLATAYAHVVNRGGLKDTKSKPVSPGALGAEIRIPAACGGEGEKIAVTYDIMEVGVALGDAKLSKGAYTQTVNHPLPPCGSTGAGLPDIDDIPMCPDDVTPINDAKDNCTCPEGKKYNAETNSCEANVCTHVSFTWADNRQKIFEQYKTLRWSFSPAGCQPAEPDREVTFQLLNAHSNSIYVFKDPTPPIFKAKTSDREVSVTAVCKDPPATWPVQGAHDVAQYIWNIKYQIKGFRESGSLSSSKWQYKNTPSKGICR